MSNWELPLDEDGMYQCKICEKKIKGYNQCVSVHMKRTHKLKYIDYVIKYENFTEKKCKNCGKVISKNQNFGNYIKKSFCGLKCSNTGIYHSQYNKKYSKEEKERISKALTGRKLSKKTRKRISKALTGRKVSEETKKKISKTQTGRKVSKKTREKLSKISAKRMAEKAHFISKPEKKFRKLLSNWNIEYQTQYFLEDRVYDFYLPMHDLLVEIDGNFWHCNPKTNPKGAIYECQKDSIKRDKLKNELAKKYGYKLVRIWEDELETNWRIIN